MMKKRNCDNVNNNNNNNNNTNNNNNNSIIIIIMNTGSGQPHQYGRSESSGGAENAGVENAGAITRGNPSEEKTIRFQ